MGKRFVYFYFMKRKPDEIQSAVPLHIAYWKNRDLKEYMGGPFADRSGGLITFETKDIEEATRIITGDPFVAENLVENKWIKEWVMETGDSA